MRIWRAAVVSSVMCAAAVAASVGSELPVWNDGERAELEKDGWVAGGLLLSEDALPDESAKRADEVLDIAPPTADEIAETEPQANAIPEKFLQAYFDERPQVFLVDPQGLLSPVNFRDRLGFLNYHAGDSSIDLFVYVFGGDQEIPGEVREEELVERFFADSRPAAVVHYYMGAPERSALYLSPSLTDAVSAAEQRRAMESSVMQALKEADPSRQIEAFLVQMSIRAYWMERMLDGDAEAIGPVPDARTVGAPENEPTVWEALLPLLEETRRFAVPAAVAAGVLLTALAASAWMKRRARYRFPEFEVEPRLGGAHAAGVGAVISFASAAIPPASQRDQVPDYLRRA